MIFTPLPLQGAFIIDVERHEDHRGFFARTWCAREFSAHGLESQFVQSSVSFNTKKGTLRGMHFQVAPASETKLVRCTRGRMFDVLVDVRPDSATFLQWVGVELTEENRRSLYIPKGFAHGFQTLQDATEVCYQMTEFHQPECARGFRWDDPQVGITWPHDERTISVRDQQYAEFSLDLVRPHVL